jgi:hypothetical protein
MIAQDGSVWNQVQTKKVYQALMVMSVDGKPKVRRISMVVIGSSLSLVY